MPPATDQEKPDYRRRQQAEYEDVGIEKHPDPTGQPLPNL
jgi:hypothetical protein